MIRADKTFGQHFLVNEGVIRRIAESVSRQASLLSGETTGSFVVEIGPGLGALTAALLGSGLKVVALEIDKRMIDELGSRFAAEISQGRLRIVLGDALELPVEEIERSLPSGDYVVCGNLPYNVGTALVFRFLERFPRARAFCFMLQKEVVKKLLAEHGSGDYGPASVKMRLATDVLDHFWVAPGSFRPPPKVESGVFSFRRKAGALEADPLERGGRYDKLTGLLNRVFSQRRKMLRNSVPETAGTEWETKRPETLEPREFLEMLARFGLALLLAVTFGAGLDSRASPWDELYVGLERSALQGTTSSRRSADVFEATVNPASMLPEGGSGLSLHALQPHLGSRVDEASFAAGLALGAQQRLGDFGFGAYLNAPWGNASALDTGAAELVQDPWSLRARQLQFLASVAWQIPGDEWVLGASVALAYGVESLVELRLDPANPTTRLQAGFEPRPSIALGATYEPLGSGWRFALAYRERSTAEARIRLEGSVSLPSIPIPLEAAGVAAYLFEPRRVALQVIRQLAADWNLGFSVRFSHWSEMPVPLLDFKWAAPDLQSRAVPFQARNAWDLGIGGGGPVGAGFRASASYRFAQAPFRDVSFYHDRDQHVLGLGMAWSAASAPSFRYHLATRIHAVQGGGHYRWVGIGLGYAP